MSPPQAGEELTDLAAIQIGHIKAAIRPTPPLTSPFALCHSDIIDAAH